MNRISIGAIALCFLLAACGGAQKSERTESTTPKSPAPSTTVKESSPAGATTSPTSTAPPTSVPPPKGGQIVTTPSGLKYEELAIGTGASPIKGHRVQVHYTGWLTDGSKFDSSRDRGTPYDFAVGMGNVIRGWDEALMTMKVGGKRKLTIPPQLAYGAAGRLPVIPPNATLIFEVELVGAQ